MTQSSAVESRVFPSGRTDSSASITGVRWLAEARAGIDAATCPWTSTRPAASCWRTSRYPSDAASALAYSSLVMPSSVLR